METHSMPKPFPPMPVPGPRERPAVPATPPDRRQIGIDRDGRPIYDQNDRTPVIINHHHYAPRPRLDPRDVLAWTLVAGAVSVLLIAVSLAAMALAITAVSLTISTLVLYAMYRHMKTQKNK
jgi:hypothetical protein